jgi:hypothetical protein
VIASRQLKGDVARGRFDRPQQLPALGAAAPLSAKATPNYEPLQVDQLLGYARELVESPEAQPAPTLSPA